MKLVLSSEALEDFERLRVFLANHNSHASIRAAEAIIHAAETLLDFPRCSAPSQAHGARELVVPFGSGACLMRYAIVDETDELIILRLWHSREDRGQ
ncbi:type II toxin-antitoxin system RelE/ParE family toxin [uncultured Maricaulis sp.]|uniref:type II toxin-antitoxin system RelE/ParE family toxin n=1 Tax=uncultured Maricaulis sp. TaxID=174710 RepID=UPI0030DA1B43